MGNAYALKIKKINENSMLRDVVFSRDKHVVEFVYFITKLNKYYVENFRKNGTINEFTLFNTYTRKEFNVVIERVESGYFFEGLEYSIEILPNLEKVLLVSNVSDGGPGFRNGVKSKTTILLGNEDRYFQELKDVEAEIKKKNANFIFYDFEENVVERINFEEYRDKTNYELRMGVELEVKNVKDIIFEKKALGNISSLDKNHLNTGEKSFCKYGNSSPIEHFDEILNLEHMNNNLKSVQNIQNDVNCFKEGDGASKSPIDVEININSRCEALLTENPQNYDKVEIAKVETNYEGELAMARPQVFAEINVSSEEFENLENVEPPILNENFLNNIEPENTPCINDVIKKDKYIQIGIMESDTSNNMKKYRSFEKMGVDYENENEDAEIKFKATLSEVRIESEMNYEISGEDFKIDLQIKETESNLTSFSDTLTSPDNVQILPTTTTSPIILSKPYSNKIKIKSSEHEYSRNLRKCKEKYTKNLSIYEKIDSHYNFMTINKIQPSLNETVKTTLDTTNLDANDKILISIPTIHKMKVLIKGFYHNKNFDSNLQNNITNFKSLKILDLHQNTKNINIINHNSPKFI